MRVLSTYGSRGVVERMVGLVVRVRGHSARRRGCACSRTSRSCWPVSACSWCRSASRRAAELVAAQFDTVAVAAKECDALVATGVMPAGVWL